MATWIRTIKLSFKGVLLHPLRSALTILGIFIGVASVIWLLAIGEGIGQAAHDQIASLGANNIIVRTVKPPSDDAGDSSYGLTRDDYERMLATIPTIEKMIPMRVMTREFRYLTRSFEGRLVGSTPDYADVTNLKQSEGRFLNEVDVQKEAKVCVLAAETAGRLFPGGDSLGKRIMVDKNIYIVVGVMKQRNSSAGIGGSLAAEDYSRDVYVPISTLWRRNGDMDIITKPGTFLRDTLEISQITIRVKDRDRVLQTAAIVRNTIEQEHTLDDFTVTIPLELLEQARTTRLMFILFLGLIAAISLVVGGIGIMNIMLATVTERTREIGVRRALGAKRRDITRQFLVESTVLSVIGGGLGLLGGLLCPAITVLGRKLMLIWFPKQMENLPEVILSLEPKLVSWSIPLAFVIAVFVGIVFGVYPAKRAAQLNPIEALRHE